MRRYFRVILPILTVCSLLFIFSNSLKNSSDVEKTKGFALGTVEAVLEFFLQRDLSVEELLKSPVVAKVGHMLEYFVFAFLFTVSVHHRRGIREKEAYSQILFACLFAALADEHLQILGVGRNPSLSDVLVDFSACLMGYGAGGLVFSFWERRKNRRERSIISA